MDRNEREREKERLRKASIADHTYFANVRSNPTLFAKKTPSTNSSTQAIDVDEAFDQDLAFAPLEHSKKEFKESEEIDFLVSTVSGVDHEEVVRNSSRDSHLLHLLHQKYKQDMEEMVDIALH